MEENKMEEMQEFVTFHITTKDGEDVELAVVDEFEYDHKSYVAAAVVKDDAVLEDDGVFLYRANVKDEELNVEQITDEKEFKAVSEAYLALENE